MEIVLANRLEPREGTAIGASARPASSNKVIFARPAACTSARNCQASSDLPSASSLRLQRIGQRQIHVVAAEQDVLADADALEFEVAGDVGHGDQAEIGGAAADVAHQDDVAGATASRHRRPARAAQA